MRRLCIFSFYDPEGIVDDYVIYFLKKLRPFVQHIFCYSNGDLTPQSMTALGDVVDEVIIRPNVGFDVLAYKEGLQKISFNKTGIYDEILMVNHTCYGPIYPFSELFDAMESRECDFWGVTAHKELIPNPFTGTGRLPFHFNTNFIAVRRNMLSSDAFLQYWNNMEASLDYESAIQSHEAFFTKRFTDLGYVGNTYLDANNYGSHYPAILSIDDTLIDRNPLLKRRAFFHDPRFLEHYCGDLPRALRIMEQTSDYDTSMIWRNITRSAELRTLGTNAARIRIFPDVRLKEGCPVPVHRVAICVHVYYLDMLEEIISLADTIPYPYDFIATTESEEKKVIIERKMSGHKNVANLIVRVVEQNRGRDMSALFITCRDLFLEDRYDLVCRLHTKKSPQVDAGRANMFKRHLFENLLNSPGYTANILDLFHDNPDVGVAVPPIVHIGYPTMGHAWFNNRPKADEIARVLDLKVPFDPHTPIGAFGTMFWFRPKALRKLFAYPWKWEDFNAEPHHVDGGLAHVHERLICYVAQDARYTTMQIISSHQAEWNFAMLEYKYQKLSSLLPNGAFVSQMHILENLQQNGSLQMTVRQAMRELVHSSKRSVVVRYPRVAKHLRPIYLAVRGFYKSR